MPLMRFVGPVDIRAVWTNLCVLLRFLAIVLLVPVLMSLLLREFLYIGIFLALAAVGCLSGTLVGRHSRIDLEGKEALFVIALACLIYAFR